MLKMKKKFTTSKIVLLCMIILSSFILGSGSHTNDTEMMVWSDCMPNNTQMVDYYDACTGEYLYSMMMYCDDVIRP
ncbi:MAG: hypothetical protein CR997_09925 [Acidobacteria bacterium]|nr:MAG: hypothetical protein CR997_09925 [Acidobacteriota bacterium]